MNEQLEEILNYYETECSPSSSENLVSMLHEIQEAEGCVSKEAQETITHRFSIKQTYLSAIIKRYPRLKEQAARCEIKVCTGGRCSAQGSLGLLKEFETHLDIKKGQTTADGQFSLTTCSCLRRCAKGPNVMVNGVCHSSVDSKQVSAIIGSQIP